MTKNMYGFIKNIINPNINIIKVNKINNAEEFIEICVIIRR